MECHKRNAAFRLYQQQDKKKQSLSQQDFMKQPKKDIAYRMRSLRQQDLKEGIVSERSCKYHCGISGNVTVF